MNNSKVPRWSPNPPASSSTPTLNTRTTSSKRFFPFSISLNSSSTTSRRLDHIVDPVANDAGEISRILQSADVGSVAITWTDVGVQVPGSGKGGSGPRAILEGVNGYAQPGEVLAVMGPSGCGKSTLLDTLAGRLKSNIKRVGEILINGRRQDLAYGASAYVAQDDTLMTTLTVKETIYYSAELQLPTTMSKAEKLERADMVIQELGLQDVMNVRIGGWNVRGISGGQKRRVSICIEIITRPSLLFLDEPTSGLDSAASYHVMSRIIQLAKKDQMTVVASIHQPSSEVFELFHNLCLLSYGKLVYFGPTLEANEFFASSGYPCPSHRNPSDHFLRIINKDFDKDVHPSPEEGESLQDAVGILVQSYQSSSLYEQAQQRISALCDMATGRAMIEKKEKGRHSAILQSIILTRRSFVNMYRDLGYYWLRLAVYIALCLCVGTIFHDIGKSYGSIQARGSMLMFIAAFLTFMAIGGFPSFVEELKIFQRERLNGHYGVGSYVISNSLSSIPYLFMISLLPGAIAYFLVGLQKEFGHFIYFVLVLFACMLVVESLMMIVASIVPDFLMGIITGAGIQGVMMLSGGFFRLPNDLPNPFWKYPMYYIAFHTYGNEGFYKNEFEGLVFPSTISQGNTTITGNEILSSVWQVQMFSKWVDLAILIGMVVIYRTIFLLIIKATEKIKSHYHIFGGVKSG